MGFNALQGLADTLGIDTGGGDKVPPASNRTRVVVEFYTDQPEEHLIGQRGNFTDALRGLEGVASADPESPFHIVGFTWNKSFGGGPGAWTLTVKARDGRDLLKMWPDPEDVWVRIYVEKNGKPTDVVFGLVNTVSEALTRSPTGARSVIYTISGQCFEKVLARTALFVNIYDALGAVPDVALFSAIKDTLAGPPNEICKGIIRAWLGNNGAADKQWILPKNLGAQYFYDLLDQNIEDGLRGQAYDLGLTNPMQWDGYSIWDLLDEYSNGLLNELYTQLDPTQPFNKKHPWPQLVLRERPLPSHELGRRKYDALPSVKLTTKDVAQRTMARGAPESRFNYWLLDATGMSGNSIASFTLARDDAPLGGGLPGAAPIFSVADIKKHGLRRFKKGTMYLPVRENEVTWFGVATRWLNLLHDWYSVVPFEMSGTITTTSIQPKIQIGMRIDEERPDGRTVSYYCEGVQHSYSYPGPGSTTLHLTRGEFDDEDLLAHVYEGLRVENVDLFGTLGTALELTDALFGPPDSGNFTGQNIVPHGSGPRLDKKVGQVPSPERAYLLSRGLLRSDNLSIERGELDNENHDAVSRVSAGDLPDQLLSDELEAESTGVPLPPGESNNLSQRELEQGVRLPTNTTQQQNQPPSSTSRADRQAAAKPSTRVRRPR